MQWQTESNLCDQLINEGLQLRGNNAHSIEAGVERVLSQQGGHNLLVSLPVILHAIRE